MSVWLDSSGNSNKFKQSYFRDFVDVSGEVLIRNGLSLKLYNNNVPTRVQFSINSNEFRIYNDSEHTYYDISNTKLIYLQDLSENVQAKLNQVNTFQSALNLKANASVVDSSFVSVNSLIATKASTSIVDASFTLVNSAIATKASISIVDASLNLKPDIAYLDASLNAKPSFSQVDASMNLKANLSSPTFTGEPTAPTASYDNSSNQLATTGFVQGRISSIINSAPAALDTLNELAAALGNDANYAATVTNTLSQKANINDVNAELALKATITSVDASLNLKSNLTYVDAALNAKPSFSQVDASLNLKSNVIYVDASLNAKPSFSQVDASLNLKSDIISVDASLNLKANLVSPTFTGTPNAPTASYDNSSNQLATTGFVQGRISSIINGAPAALDTLYELAAALGNDANYASTVTNALSQKANTADVNAELALKATITSVDASLNLKSNVTYVDASLNAKPNFSQVDASLNLKSNVTYVDASLNAKPSFSQVDASLNAKPSFSQVDASLNAKPSFSQVDASLNLKPSFSQVDASLNTKPSFSQVDASLNTKPSFSQVDASLNTKPSFSQVDASLNLKSDVTSVDASLILKANLISPTFTGTPNAPTASYDNSSNQIATTGFVQGRISSIINSAPAALDTLNELAAALGNDANYAATVTNSLSQKANTTDVNSALALKATTAAVDASLNLKSNVTYVDASLNAKPSFSQVDASLNAKPSFSQVDASLNLKSDRTYVDLSLNAKASFTYVDNSLNLKANVASPTFTGIVTAAKLTSGDASFNGNVDISGVLSVTQTVNSVVKNTTINNYNVSVTNDLSLNGKLIVSSDVSLNSKLYIKGDASFNGRVDICGNFYANYPNNSIPSSAISNGVTLSYVDSSLNLKPSFAQVDASLNAMINSSQFDASLNLKSNVTYVDASLNLKPSFSQVDTSLNLKSAVTYVDASLNLKPSFSQVDTSLNLKSAVTYVDASLNLKSSVTYVDSSLNLKANLASPTFTGTPNAPTASYDNSSNQIATTGFVQGRISSIINSAPAALDTLNELAAALGNDANYAATVTNLLSQKANATDVNSALALKPSFLQVDASLNLKPSFSQVDASLNLKPSFSQIDASLNLKASVTYVDSSLSLKPSFSQVDASLNLKPTFAQVDASLNAILDFSQVDASLNLKPSFSQVDASLNLKAALASPTFTGIPNAPTASYDNSSNQIATTGFVQGRISSIINSAPAALDTLNELAAALGNDANYAATVTNSLSQKANATDVNTALALKPTFAEVDASLNMKPTSAQVDASLNLKPSFSQVDASLNLKPTFAQVDASLNAIINMSQVDASLNLKPNFSQVDVSLNLKPSFSQVDVSLNLKPSFSQVDASLNLKSDRTYVDLSLNSKASFSQVDASLNLKANVASPTFTGIVTASKLTSGDASFNGNIDISGVLSVTQTVNSVVKNTTINNYNVNVTNDLSLNGKLIVSSDVSLNSKLYVIGDASFNGRVDICGNFYANYPANSIPSSAIIGGVSSGSTSSVDISSNQTISGVKTFTNGLNVGPILVSSVTGNPSFQRVQIGQDIDGEAASDQSGYFVSMNSDGTVVAIGAPFNDGTANMAGHVRVYKNINGTWTKLGQDIDGEADSDQSGWSVSLSSDGTIVAIAANRNDGTASNAGHVRVYKYNGSTTWTKLGQDIDGEATNDGWSGYSVSLSSDGTIVAIGSPYNSGSAAQSGSVRVYKYNGSTTWTKLGQDIDGEASGDQSGYSVSISSDGTIVAIGAPYNTSSASGEGQVRVYKYNGSTTWTQIGQDIDGEATSVTSGYSISLSSDGTVVAIGAVDNDGTSGSNSDNRGSVRVYKYNGSTWTKLGQDLDGEASSNQSGRSVSISGDGTIIAIGAPFNTGTNTGAGHVRIYQYSGTTWTQLGTDIDGEAAYDSSGMAVSLSTDGVFVAIGATDNDANGTSSGHVRVYKIRDLTTTKVIVSNNLDICGNLYAQYAAASIPASAINGISTTIQTAIDLKATRTIVDASFTSVNSAISLKANLASPALTGVPTAPTATAGTNTTQLATTEFTTTALSTKANLASPALTGVPTAPTATAGTNTTQLATTAFTTTALSTKADLANPTFTGNVVASKMRVTSDASFNGRVDICGNFYAQYPASSIPSSAIIGGVGGSNGSVDISSNQTISGVKTFTNGLNVGNTLVSSVAAAVTFDPSFQRVKIGQDIDGEAADDQSGFAVSLSADGTIVAIGARFNDGTASNAGQVRVYKNISGTWTKLGQDIDGEATPDQSGYSVSLSSDGTIVAIGAIYNDGGGSDSGHVRVYKYNGSTTWTQLGQDINGEAAANWSGFSVSISSDGTIVAIGAWYNDGNGNDSGHVRMYQYNNGSAIWTQIGQDIDGEAANDQSGYSVSLSSNGQIVAIGARYNAGTVAASYRGQARVYQYNGTTTWTQIGQDIDGEASQDFSGSSVSLSSDGTIVAIGAVNNDGTTGTSTDNRGSIRVYKNINGTWTQLGQDIDGEAAGDNSGFSISLNGDGTVIAIGAYLNDGTGSNSGHVRIYQFISNTWQQLGSDVDGEAAGDQSGYSVSLSRDGTMLAVGANANDGVNGLDSGHVRVYQIRSAITASTKLTIGNNVDICGNFYAQYAAASIPASAINGISSAIQTAIDLKATKTIVDASFTTVNSAIELKANLASPTFTGNVVASKMRVTSDASFNGRVDICGNFYAQYPASSIPSSAIIGGVGGGGGGGSSATDISINSLSVGRGGGNNICNTVLGVSAGAALPVDSANNTTAIGAYALSVNNVVGGNNTAIGFNALKSHIGGFCTAVGGGTLQNNTTGYMNVGVGSGPLTSNTTGSYNVAMNWGALGANNIGNDNIAIGKQALTTNQSGSNNIGIGTLAMQGTTSSSNNTAVGHRSLVYSSTGSSNTAFGYLAGQNNSTGSFNTYIGYGADLPSYGATWSNSTAIGANAMITASNQIVLGTAAETVFIPGKSTTSGDASFNGRVDICGNFYAKYPASSIPSSAIIGGVGGGSGINLTADISVNSLTVGRGSGNNSSNTAFGVNALFAQTADVNSNSTAIGYYALSANQAGSGVNNSAVGFEALKNNTIGNFNTALGSAALRNNTTGGSNTALGASSLTANTTGNSNVAINGGLNSNTTGSDNISIGKQTLTANQTGGKNIGIGTLVLQGITSSSNNTAVGHRSLVYSSSGNSNTAFGYLAGQNNSTGSFNTYIGFGADLPAFGATWSNSTAIGANAMITASNQITLGTAAERVFIPGKLSTSGDASFNGRLDIGTNSVTPFATLAVAQIGTNLLGRATARLVGSSTALNDAGTIVAVGCPADGNFIGSVRIYQWSGTAWTQLGQDIVGTADNTQFGNAVSLSSTGFTIAIGGFARNLVRVYQYASNVWTQVGADIVGTGGAGSSVSISADGLTVAIGAPNAYINGGQDTGQTRIYKYISSAWTQLGQDLIGEAASNRSGFSLQLSADGTIVVIGAHYNDGTNPNGTIRYMSGHARIYKYANSTWTQLGQDIDGEVSYDMSGWSVAISDDGTIVAIGAPRNTTGATTYNGHARIYKYANNTWTQVGQDIDGRAIWAQSGSKISLSADGYTVAIGSESANGLGGEASRGYAVVYKYNGSTWSMVGSYIEGQAAQDQFGYSISLSADGTILSVGAPYNNSSTGYVKVYKVQTPSSKIIVSDGLDICGNLYANSLQLTSSATFNGRVDICGNFYAQYPPNSIPASAIIGGVGSSSGSSGSSGSSTGANVTFTDNFALIKEAVVVDPASILLRQF